MNRYSSREQARIPAPAREGNDRRNRCIGASPPVAQGKHFGRRPQVEPLRHTGQEEPHAAVIQSGDNGAQQFSHTLPRIALRKGREEFWPVCIP